MTARKEIERRERPGHETVDPEEAVTSRIGDVGELEDGEVTGQIQHVSIVDDPCDDLLQLAGLEMPTGNSTSEMAAVDRLRDAEIELGEAIGAENWRVPTRVAEIKVKLETGEIFTDAFRVPRADSEGELYDLVESIGVVPGTGDSLEGTTVPVERADDRWAISVPDDDEPESEQEINKSVLTGLSALMMVGGLIVTTGLMAESEVAAGIGFALFLFGLAGIDAHTPD